MKVEGRIKAEGGRRNDFGFKKGEFRRDSSFFSDYHESILEK
jgi:hypothetical protein